jgi:hypothetical protein
MSEDAAARARIARNETLFRQVNERVKDVSEAFAAVDASPVEFVCECGDRDCTEPLSLTLKEYEGIRSVPTHFIVVPDHVNPTIEVIVRRNNGYVVVEKRPAEGRRLARETDPRPS